MNHLIGMGLLRGFRGSLSPQSQPTSKGSLPGAACCCSNTDGCADGMDIDPALGGVYDDDPGGTGMWNPPSVYVDVPGKESGGDGEYEEWPLPPLLNEKCDCVELDGWLLPC